MPKRQRLYRYDHHPKRARYEERLSQQQRSVLRYLLSRDPDVPGAILLYGPDDAGRDRQRRECAEGWRWMPAQMWRARGLDWTASDRASWSRTLKRLEIRGLIERIAWHDGAHRRTRYIRLTARGKRAAKRLTI